ncbi:MAG: hypothetical protein AAGC55_24885, partial [Myxococcota bacterium]
MSARRILFVDYAGAVVRQRDGDVLNDDWPRPMSGLIGPRLVDRVIPALLELRQAGFVLVLFAEDSGPKNTDGTYEYRERAWRTMIALLAAQGVTFDD